MSFSWKTEADREAPQNAPRLKPGAQQLEVVKLVFGKKGQNGSAPQPFKSDKGHPQIMCVYSDGQGREGTEMFTLSDEAGWKLAKLLAAAGANVQKMDQANITPANFADERFANANLVGRKFTAEVQYKPGKGQNADKEYLNVLPIMPQPNGAARQPVGAGAPAFNPESNLEEEAPF
jgi:hypothetical protein